jgi:hypothetical protein
MKACQLAQQQSGAAVLIFFLILFTSSAAVLLRAINNADFGQAAASRAQQDMVLAKQTLLSFSMSYAENFPGSPPGRFPCPDSDNDAEGLPNTPCNVGNIPARLPRRMDTGAGAPFMFSDHGLLDGQRFWYAVSPAYRQSSAAVLNSNTAGTLTLDGQNDIVAMLVAPGDEMTGQTRPNNTVSNYLESTNVAGTAFVSNWAANPTLFNDRLLPIYRHEVMTLVTARVVQIIRGILTTYHPANGNTYPVDEPTFLAALTAAPPPAWFTANNWGTVVNYTFVNANSVTISFDGCAITYTVTFGQPDIARSQASCEV